MKYSELIDTGSQSNDVMAGYRRKPVSEMSEAEVDAELQGMQAKQLKPAAEMSEAEVDAELAQSKPESSWWDITKGVAASIPEKMVQTFTGALGAPSAVSEAESEIASLKPRIAAEKDPEKAKYLQDRVTALEGYKTGAGKRIEDIYWQAVDTLAKNRPNVKEGSWKGRVSGAAESIVDPVVLAALMTGPVKGLGIIAGGLYAREQGVERKAVADATRKRLQTQNPDRTVTQEEIDAELYKADLGTGIKSAMESLSNLPQMLLFKKAKLAGAFVPEAIKAPVKQFIKISAGKLVKFLGLNVGGEELSTITDNAVDWWNKTPDASIDDVTAKLKKDMWETAIQTTLQSGVMGAAAKGVEKVAGMGVAPVTQPESELSTEPTMQGGREPSFDEIFGVPESVKPVDQMSEAEVDAELQGVQAEQQFRPEAVQPVEEMPPQVAPEDDIASQMSTDIQTMYNAQKVHNISSGMTEEQARAAAFDYVQNTPQGKIDIARIKTQQAQTEVENQQAVLEQQAKAQEQALKEQAKAQDKAIETQQKEALKAQEQQSDKQPKQETEQTHETIDIATIPEALTIEESIMNKSGQSTKIKTNAREAYTASQERVSKYKSLLECLRS